VIQFVIEDEMPKVENSLKPPRYEITISFGTRDVFLKQTFFSAGLHSVVLQSPPDQAQTILTIKMVDHFGHSYFDYMPISFNLYFYKIFKWLVIIPFLGMCAVIIFVHEMKQISLPQLRSDIKL